MREIGIDIVKDVDLLKDCCGQGGRGILFLQNFEIIIRNINFY